MRAVSDLVFDFVNAYGEAQFSEIRVLLFDGWMDGWILYMPYHSRAHHHYQNRCL